MSTEHTARPTSVLTWFKSSYSGTGGGECLEAAVSEGVYVRDSKNTTGPILHFTPDQWQTFTSCASITQGA